MRTKQRLLAIKQWTIDNLCKGYQFKIPDKGGDMTEFHRGEPSCFVAWQPMYPDESGHFSQAPIQAVPAIIIMPNFGYLRYYDKPPYRNDVPFPDDMGQGFNIQMLFSIWEPGVRMPGFYESAVDGKGYDMTKLIEGTEEGLFTLTDWMDDAVEKILGAHTIPGTDLVLQSHTSAYSLYTEGNTIPDKRPIFYGFLNLGFNGYAAAKPNKAIEDCLR